MLLDFEPINNGNEAMTILRSGATKKYSENWSAAFGGKKSKAKASKKSAAKKPTAKKKKKAKK